MTVEALRSHRPETLGELLETYGPELQAVAYLILRDRADAEDVVVETLLTAFEKGGSIRDERALRAGLMAEVHRPVPVLVNPGTGERIELVNLPHWIGNYGD